MARARKTEKAAGSSTKSKGFNLLEDEEAHGDDGQEDLPKDEAGRRKIKRQYEELLGIRIEKLKGRILNRERINKTIEGIYFICASCRKVCHNVDDVAFRQQELAADHHGGPGQDAELGEQRSDPAWAAELDGPTLRAQMDTHGAKDRTLAREFWRLKVTPSS